MLSNLYAGNLDEYSRVRTWSALPLMIQNVFCQCQDKCGHSCSVSLWFHFKKGHARLICPDILQFFFCADPPKGTSDFGKPHAIAEFNRHGNLLKLPKKIAAATHLQRNERTSVAQQTTHLKLWSENAQQTSSQTHKPIHQPSTLRYQQESKTNWVLGLAIPCYLNQVLEVHISRSNDNVNQSRDCRHMAVVQTGLPLRTGGTGGEHERIIGVRRDTSI